MPILVDLDQAQLAAARTAKSFNVRRQDMRRAAIAMKREELLTGIERILRGRLHRYTSDEDAWNALGVKERSDLDGLYTAEERRFTLLAEDLAICFGPFVTERKLIVLSDEDAVQMERHYDPSESWVRWRGPWNPSEMLRCQLMFVLPNETAMQVHRVASLPPRAADMASLNQAMHGLGRAVGNLATDPALLDNMRRLAGAASEMPVSRWRDRMLAEEPEAMLHPGNALTPEERMRLLGGRFDGPAQPIGRRRVPAPGAPQPRPEPAKPAAYAEPRRAIDWSDE